MLNGIPRRWSPDGANRRGCPHARQKPRDPPVRVQIAGAGAAQRPRRPMTATRPGGQPCCQTRGCITAPDRQTGDGEAELEANDHGRADRAWAEHRVGTLDERGGGPGHV